MKAGSYFLYKGRKENFNIEGSCRTSRINASESKEKHPEAPINLAGKTDKKEEPKPNTGFAMCSF
jgi:hypothetical protein